MGWDVVVGLDPALPVTHKLKLRRLVDGGCLRNGATFSGRELDLLLEDWRGLHVGGGGGLVLRWFLLLGRLDDVVLVLTFCGHLNYNQNFKDCRF